MCYIQSVSYLGKIVNNKGEHWELQFKGSGKTPYLQTADGRKVLCSSIQEYSCSEVSILQCYCIDCYRLWNSRN